LLITVTPLELGEETDNYNTQFWNRLQDEWKNMSSEGEQQHPWMSDFNEFHDPYKVDFSIKFKSSQS